MVPMKYATSTCSAPPSSSSRGGLSLCHFRHAQYGRYCLKARQIEGAPLMTLCALFLIGLCHEGGGVPVNFWLPASYHTPRISVSAVFGGC